MREFPQPDVTASLGRKPANLPLRTKTPRDSKKTKSDSSSRLADQLFPVIQRENRSSQKSGARFRPETGSNYEENERKKTGPGLRQRTFIG